jgi:hypothetical protein
MNENKARIDPNYSFDLCRLGCSIFDFIIDDCDVEFSKLNDFQKIVYTWCQDDNGKNVLYKRNGEERYHNFKLYKMIARTVHQHTPEAQLELPIFKQYLVENKVDDTPLNNSIRTADELSSKLPVTDLNIAPQRDADSNLHRYKIIDIDVIPCYA